MKKISFLKREATQVSTDKMDMVSTYNGILFSHKEDEVLMYSTTWTNL